MTLSVYACKIRSDGTSENLVPVKPCNDLAGVESARRSFYGSADVRKLGLTLLPTLEHSNLYVMGEELDRLEREVRILHAHINSAADAAYWSFRLNNILEALRLAKSVTGGVGMVCIE